ncbi:MAG: hypothetical protein QOH51_236 [Acidobacteriota bacterium]|nr:hypothetical protein [Acidobacteriota bacterium]
MIRLHPIPEASYVCPSCSTALEPLGWYIPGMRNLADLRCPRCAREFYGDLPSGQALYTPMLLEKQTGTVHDSFGVEWFAGWLRDSYAGRTDAPVSFDVSERLEVGREVVLLNCLDTLYGHSLLKLLNAQHYLDSRPDLDVLVIAPPFLEWMIPDGVAQVWLTGLPLRRGTEWNDWIARELHRRVESLPAANVYLSLAFSHPHPNDFRIERFTRVLPFPLQEWEGRLSRPTVTFVWREDRLWNADERPSASVKSRLMNKSRLMRSPKSPAERQCLRVLAFADALRRDWPALDFAVAGIGEPGGLPVWMSDLRRTAPDARTERAWCERYAASHVVVGMHGSNMLLPSAHAGASIELLGPERWGNFLQDILFRPEDCRELFFRHRFVPPETTHEELARLTSSILRGLPDFRRLMNPEFVTHDEISDASRWRMRRGTSASE